MKTIEERANAAWLDYEYKEGDLQFLPLNMKWIATYNYARVLDLERQARAAGARQLKSVQLTIF